MTLKEMNDLATIMICNFINHIGYDGQSYVKSMGNFAIFIVDQIDDGGWGRYVDPGNIDEINVIAKTKKLNEKQINTLLERGCIEISKNHVLNDSIEYIIMTIIHERFHANRNLLLWDVNSNTGYTTYDNGVQMSNEYELQYVDPNQDVLKGKFDTSKNSVSLYSNKTTKEIKQIVSDNFEDINKRNYDIEVDEALIELMTIMSYKLYKSPGSSLMELIDLYSKTVDDDEKIVNMCKIILNHQDFELFKWMLNPIEYSYGDIHYDFFKDYTKNDPKEFTEIFGNKPSKTM